MVKYVMRSEGDGRIEQHCRQRFERLVARALDDLPREVLAMLDNVAVVVEDEPTAEQLAADGDGGTLFGLYEGVPRTERNGGDAFLLPDKVTLFRRPLEAAFPSPSALAREVRVTVIHELAHHLGLDETRIRDLGWE